MATATIEPGPVGHVYEALGNILNSLSVAKGGTLPSNMGGKPYITAVDAALETKRQFVANDLIFLPNETVFKHEIIVHKDRLNVAIVVTGEYTIVSTRDGSRVTVSGTGDGLAAGTAVASNIASTNALKNALLRTFLITEQSAEDAAKNGTPDAVVTPAQQKLNKARAATPAAPVATPGASLKDKIRTDYIETGKATKEQVNDAMNKHKADGKTGDALWQAVIDTIGA